MPELRVLEEMSAYEHQPPFGELALTSSSLFGIVSCLTERGVDVLETWLTRNPGLKVRLVVMLYRRPRRPIEAIDETLQKKGQS